MSFHRTETPITLKEIIKHCIFNKIDIVANIEWKNSNDKVKLSVRKGVLDII